MMNGRKKVKATMEQSLKLIKEQQEAAGKIYRLFSQLLESETLELEGVDLLDIENYDEDYLEDVRKNAYITVAGGAPRDWYLGMPARDMDMYFLTSDFDKFFKNLSNGQYPSQWYVRKGAVRVVGGVESLERDYFGNNQVNRSPLLIWLGDRLIENGYMFTKLKDKSYGEGVYKNPVIACVFELELEGHTFDLIFLTNKKEGVVYVDEYKSFVRITATNYLKNERVDPNTGLTINHAHGSFGDFVIGTYDFNICRAYYDFSSEEIVTSQHFLDDINNKTLTIMNGSDRGLLYRAIFNHYAKLKVKFPDFTFNPEVIQKV